MSKILIFGDVHIGLSFSNYTKTKTNLQQKYVEINIRFIDKTINDVKPDIVIFLGDIFDKPKVEPSYISSFITILNKYDEIKFYLLSGNHDYITLTENNILKIFEFLPNVSVIDNIRIEDEFVFIPYLPINKLIDVDIRSFENKLLFTHLDIGYLNTQFMVTPDELGLNAKYIFNGHIHKPYKKGNFINLGSLSPTSFAESNNIHKALIFDTETNRMNFIDNNSIKFFDINNITDIDFLHKESDIIRRMNDSLIFVRYGIEFEDFINELDNIYQFDVMQLNVKKKDRESIINDSDIKNLNSTIKFEDIESVFKEYIKQKYSIELTDL